MLYQLMLILSLNIKGFLLTTLLIYHQMAMMIHNIYALIQKLNYQVELQLIKDIFYQMEVDMSIHHKYKEKQDH